LIGIKDISKKVDTITLRPYKYIKRSVIMNDTVVDLTPQEQISSLFFGIVVIFGLSLFMKFTDILLSPSRTSTVITGTGKAYLGSDYDDSDSDSELVRVRKHNCLKVQLLDKSMEEFYQERINHNTDSGFDLYIPKDTTIQPQHTVLVGMGVKCEPDYAFPAFKCGYYLYPRSSIYKTGLFMANSVGVIDYEYRGEIKAALHNLTDKPVIVKRGQRIAQLCMSDLRSFEVQFIDSLTETVRGEGGFGSTDKKDTQSETKVDTNVDSANSHFTDAMNQVTSKNVTPIIEEDKTLKEPDEGTTSYVVTEEVDQVDQSEDESDNEDNMIHQPSDANDSDGDSMKVQVDAKL
jgi:dUTP pyrophosphatase